MTQAGPSVYWDIPGMNVNNGWALGSVSGGYGPEDPFFAPEDV
jgi:hypothetical protein